MNQEEKEKLATYKQKYYQEHITHKSLEHECDKLMEEKGWDRVVGKKEKIAMNDDLGNQRPDRIYVKKGEWPLVFEIKPGNARHNEIIRGIGQVVAYLPYQVKPYLVISSSQWDKIHSIFKLIPFLGALLYEGSSRFVIAQKALSREPDELRSLDIEIRPKITIKFLSRFIDDFRESPWGTLLSDIVSKIEEEYPSLDVYPPVVARTLIELGYEPRYTPNGNAYYVFGESSIIKNRAIQRDKFRLTQDMRDEIVTATQNPPQGVPWSARQLAREMGVSYTTIYRIWRERGLMPQVKPISTH